MTQHKPLPLGKVYPELQKMLEDKDARINKLEREIKHLLQANQQLLEDRSKQDTQIEQQIKQQDKQIEQLHHDVDQQYQLKKDDAKAFREQIDGLELKLRKFNDLAMREPATNCMYGPACGNHVKSCDEASVPPRCFSTSAGTNKKNKE
jgi:exonuclease VII large subunit